MKCGDVVIDGYSGRRVTIESIDGDHAKVAWFEGSEFHRGSLLLRNLTLAE